MIGTSVQLIAGFLAHTTLGVNALVSDLPRNRFAAPGDTPVAQDAPPLVAIYNDAEHAGLTFEEGFRPTDGGLPAILVLRETREIKSGGEADRSRTPSPKTIGVVIAYVTDAGADKLTAQAACETLLRAAERSLRRYKNQANSEGYRELNGVRVMDVPRWTRVEETVAVNTVKFWGWLDVELQVVDLIT